MYAGAIFKAVWHYIPRDRSRIAQDYDSNVCFFFLRRRNVVISALIVQIFLSLLYDVVQNIVLHFDSDLH